MHVYGVVQALGEVPKKMRDGMAALLDMHNSDELRFLGQSFDLPDDMTRQERMRALKVLLQHSTTHNVCCSSWINKCCSPCVWSDLLQEVVLTDEIQYRRVLRAIWEGIIIEYWRSLGKSIKHYRLDLRRMVWSYWLKEQYVVLWLLGCSSCSCALHGDAGAASASVVGPVECSMEKNQKASEFIPIYADLQVSCPIPAMLPWSHVHVHATHGLVRCLYPPGQA